MKLWRAKPPGPTVFLTVGLLLMAFRTMSLEPPGSSLSLSLLLLFLLSLPSLSLSLSSLSFLCFFFFFSDDPDASFPSACPLLGFLALETASLDSDLLSAASLAVGTADTVCTGLAEAPQPITAWASALTSWIRAPHGGQPL